MFGSAVRQKLRGAANVTIGASMHQDLTPNITGFFTAAVHTLQYSGAFSEGGRVMGRDGKESGAGVNYSFAADKSSSIYGSTPSVQPPAILTLPCIKA